jgi:hypothetical protein
MHWSAKVLSIVLAVVLTKLLDRGVCAIDLSYNYTCIDVVRRGKG